MAAASSSNFTNRLAKEKSPYLLQHAHNPVDWFPWGQEAFDKARNENKMIFLSVGYSTCHWCHVMERESFENEEIGQLMNEHFVNIKVDREERPDVDRMYMTFIQAISSSGGWPMSVFLTPDLKPITGGTYFPPHEQFGRPGFSNILKYIATQWREKKSDILSQGTQFTDAIYQISKQVGQVPDSSAKLSTFEIEEKCYEQLFKTFDPRFGGFSKEPKFPQPVNLDFLARYYKHHLDTDQGKKALEMYEKTLVGMIRGGIHDHVSQGFHRYSTDQRWHVPHFEKMLYDQGQLAVSFAESYQITANKLYADTLRDILLYVDRDLSHPKGGFYSAEDADSFATADSKEKKEGAFCVWTYEQTKQLLNEPLKTSEPDGKKLFDLFARHYTVREGGNLHAYADPHGELTNQNVLIAFNSVEESGKEFGLNESETEEILDKCRQILFKERAKRPRPHLDSKMVTAWNGLMISGFARASLVLHEEKYKERAVRAAQFVRQHLTDPKDSSTLLRSCYTDSRDSGNVENVSPPIEGFVDDYAFLIAALLDLYECTYDSQYIEWAERLQKRMDELFWDKELDCGYFMSAEKDKSILVRIKDDQDGAEPSANSVGAVNLVRLSDIVGDSSLRERSRRLLRGFEERLRKVAIILPKMITALPWLERSPTQIVIVGPRSDVTTRAMIDAVHSKFLPEKILILLDPNEDCWLKSRVAHLKDLEMVDGKATAYVCENFSCSLPVNTANQLLEKLN